MGARTPPPAHHDQPARDVAACVAEEPVARRRWYGWQTLTSDGGSAGLLLIAGPFSPWWSSSKSSGYVNGREVCSGSGCPSTSRSISSVLAGLGGAGYFLSAPIVHLAHGRGGKAAGSFGLRIPPPLIVGAAGLSCFNLVADIAYAAQARWLPPGWAISQIVIGGGVNGAVAVWGIELHSGNGCVESTGAAAPGMPAPPQPNACNNILPLTVGAAVLSVGFIAHGVASLVPYEPPAPAKGSAGAGGKSQSAYVRWVPDIVVTRDRKTLVAFSGVF